MWKRIQKLIKKPVVQKSGPVIPALAGYWKIYWDAAFQDRSIILSPKAATSKKTTKGASGPMPTETYSGLVVSLKDYQNFNIRVRWKFKQLRQNLRPMNWECFWFIFGFKDLSKDGVWDKVMNCIVFKPKEIQLSIASKEVVEGFLGNLPGDSAPDIEHVAEIKFQDGKLSVILNGKGACQDYVSPKFYGAGKIGLYCEDARVEVLSVEEL